jgi:RHS repeat-associated protein
MYNGHGDIVQTTDKSGNINNKYDYDAFGNSTLTDEKSSNSIRYAGEFYDDASELYYLRARYYNPKTTRFISEDSYEGEEDDPSSLNRYTYCGNEPMLNIDPSGHDFTGALKMGAPIIGRLAPVVIEAAPEVVIGAGIIYGGWKLCNYINDNVGDSYNSEDIDVGINVNIDIGDICSDISLPKLDFNTNIGNIDMGKIDLSNMDFNFPKIDINIPKIEINIPKIEINIPKIDLSGLDNLNSELEKIFTPQKINVNVSDFQAVDSSTTNIDTGTSAGAKVTSLPLEMPKTLEDGLEVFNPDQTSLEDGIIVDNPDSPRTIQDSLEVFNPTTSSVQDGITSDDFSEGSQLVGPVEWANKVSDEGTIKTDITRVGRWMSEVEYNRMVETGYVQMSGDNKVHVANPADIDAFRKQAPKGSIYVEFDVPSNTISQGGTDSWGIINGPGSLLDRLNARKGLPPITEMPKPTNIEIKGGK